MKTKALFNLFLTVVAMVALQGHANENADTQYVCSLTISKIVNGKELMALKDIPARTDTSFNEVFVDSRDEITYNLISQIYFLTKVSPTEDGRGQELSLNVAQFNKLEPSKMKIAYSAAGDLNSRVTLKFTLNSHHNIIFKCKPRLESI